jgi:hypothetical protein
MNMKEEDIKSVYCCDCEKRYPVEQIAGGKFCPKGHDIG